MLSDEELDDIYHDAAYTNGGQFLSHATGLRAVATASTQAERHRIYAALEADPSALWRDQGFQEWRRKRGENTDS
jgi:hypothetical protein